MTSMASQRRALSIILPPEAPWFTAIPVTMTLPYETVLLLNTSITDVPMDSGLFLLKACTSGGPFTDTASGACTNAADPAAALCAYGEGSSCTACPVGAALCPGGFRTWPLTGWWAAREGPGGPLVACAPPAVRCRGWDAAAGVTLCSTGYEPGSAACALCASGYYSDPFSPYCLPCPAPGATSGLTGLQAAGALAAAVAAALAVVFVVVWALSGAATDAVAVTGQFAMTAGISLQTVAAVSRATPPGLPASYVALMSIFAAAQLEVTAAPAACTGAPPFDAAVAVLAAALGAFATLVLLSPPLHRFCRRAAASLATRAAVASGAKPPPATAMPAMPASIAQRLPNVKPAAATAALVAGMATSDAVAASAAGSFSSSAAAQTAASAATSTEDIASTGEVSRPDPATAPEAASTEVLGTDAAAFSKVALTDEALASMPVAIAVPETALQPSSASASSLPASSSLSRPSTVLALSCLWRFASARARIVTSALPPSMLLRDYARVGALSALVLLYSPAAAQALRLLGCSATPSSVRAYALQPGANGATMGLSSSSAAWAALRACSSGGSNAAGCTPSALRQLPEPLTVLTLRVDPAFVCWEGAHVPAGALAAIVTGLVLLAFPVMLAVWASALVRRLLRRAASPAAAARLHAAAATVGSRTDGFDERNDATLEGEVWAAAKRWDALRQAAWVAAAAPPYDGWRVRVRFAVARLCGIGKRHARPEPLEPAAVRLAAAGAGILVLPGDIGGSRAALRRAVIAEAVRAAALRKDGELDAHGTALAAAAAALASAHVEAAARASAKGLPPPHPPPGLRSLSSGASMGLSGRLSAAGASIHRPAPGVDFDMDEVTAANDDAPPPITASDVLDAASALRGRAALPARPIFSGMYRPSAWPFLLADLAALLLLQAIAVGWRTPLSAGAAAGRACATWAVLVALTVAQVVGTPHAAHADGTGRQAVRYAAAVAAAFSAAVNFAAAILSVEPSVMSLATGSAAGAAPTYSSPVASGLSWTALIAAVAILVILVFAVLGAARIRGRIRTIDTAVASRAREAVAAASARLNSKQATAAAAAVAAIEAEDASRFGAEADPDLLAAMREARIENLGLRASLRAISPGVSASVTGTAGLVGEGTGSERRISVLPHNFTPRLHNAAVASHAAVSAEPPAPSRASSLAFTHDDIVVDAEYDTNDEDEDEDEAADGFDGEHVMPTSAASVAAAAATSIATPSKWRFASFFLPPLAPATTAPDPAPAASSGRRRAALTPGRILPSPGRAPLPPALAAAAAIVRGSRTPHVMIASRDARPRSAIPTVTAARTAFEPPGVSHGDEDADWATARPLPKRRSELSAPLAAAAALARPGSFAVARQSRTLPSSPR